MFNKNKKKGFTLIELMIVMAIIGILMGLTLTGFMGARKTARDGRRKADLEQIRSALEMCRSDTGSYPVGTSLPGGCSAYLTMPSDPISTQSYYYYSASGTTYELCAALETGAPNDCGTANCGSATCNYKVTNP